MKACGNPATISSIALRNTCPYSTRGFAGPLGAGGDRILLADFLQEAVLGQHRQTGEAAGHHRDDRQRHVPGVIAHARRPAPVRGALAGQPAQREPMEVAAAGKQHDQQDREQEARHRVADQHHRAGGDIEPAAVVHRLADAERDRDHIDQQRGPQPERDRNRQPARRSATARFGRERSCGRNRNADSRRPCPGSASAAACRSRTSCGCRPARADRSRWTPRYAPGAADIAGWRRT